MTESRGAARGEILAIDGATLVHAAGAPRVLLGVRMILGPGDLAMVMSGPASPAWLLADASCGLATARSGAIRFLGEDWSSASPTRACALRGRIGRVFDGENWLNYASVGDNIMMRAVHHTPRPELEIRAEAERLSRHFGLPGLPTSRAHEMLNQDLRRAACVRAFMGTPELIVLEHPTRDVYPDVMGALINAVKQARDRGAAVLWITPVDSIWRDRAIHASTRARLVGAQFVLTEN